MIISEQILEDPHAPPDRRYRGYVVDSELTLTDATSPTREEALAGAPAVALPAPNAAR